MFLDHVTNKSVFLGYPERTHWSNDNRPDESRTGEVWDTGHYTCSSEGYLRWARESTFIEHCLSVFFLLKVERQVVCLLGNTNDNNNNNNSNDNDDDSNGNNDNAKK